MAVQGEVKMGGFTFLAAAVPRYVKALCAHTGLPEPAIPVTAPQMHALVRASLKATVVEQERQYNVIEAPDIE